MNTRDALVECLPALAYVRSAPNVQAEATSAAKVLDASIDLADVLAREQQPDLTAQAFVDWERNYGLPDTNAVETVVLASGLYGYKASEIAAFSRASVASYFDATGVLQYAPANTPRFTYNPANLSAGPVLLVEGASTNLAKYSEQFDNAAWAATGWGGAGVTTPNDPAYTAPDGTLTVDKITATVGGAGFGQLFNLTAGVTYTFSVWLASPTNAGRLQFQLGAGGIVASFNTPVSSSLAWYSVSYTVSTTGAYYVGAAHTVALQTFYAWGAKLEVGSAATSYIPTTAAAATRAADACSVVIPPSEAKRRSALLGRLKRLANLSRQFMVDQAAAVGYPGCTVTEFGPMTCQDPCDGATNGVEFIGVWQLNIPIATAVKYLTCESACDTALASWGNTQLEGVINRRKPANTKAIFAYAI